jgi:hypothetical protein
MPAEQTKSRSRFLPVQKRRGGLCSLKFYAFINIINNKRGCITAESGTCAGFPASVLSQGPFALGGSDLWLRFGLQRAGVIEASTSATPFSKKLSGRDVSVSGAHYQNRGHHQLKIRRDEAAHFDKVNLINTLITRHATVKTGIFADLADQTIVD